MSRGSRSRSVPPIAASAIALLVALAWVGAHPRRALARDGNAHAADYAADYYWEDVHPEGGADVVVGSDAGVDPTPAACEAALADLPDVASRLVRPGEDPAFYYFLHVPRVAGRTLNFCFLKSVFKPRDRCRSGYDGIKLEGPLEHLGHPCTLDATHDDLSILEHARMPRGGAEGQRTAVLTQLRDPVDRVLSAYEFTVEVASRGARRRRQGKKRSTRPSEHNKTRTDQVWPWEVLVPLLEDDILARRHEHPPREPHALDPHAWAWREAGDPPVPVLHNRHRNASVLSVDELGPSDFVLEPLDPYDNPLVMPLRDFVRLPEVVSPFPFPFPFSFPFPFPLLL